MPGQFIVAVASPTTLASSGKERAEPHALPVRGGRSQSLSTLSRRASTASVLTVATNQCETFSEEEASEFQHQQRLRHARRALSTGTGTSLSLLQEELGYPRRTRVETRHRRGSLFETVVDPTTRADRAGRELHSSSSSSSASSGTSTRERRRPRLESTEQDRRLGLGQWTVELTPSSPQSDAGREQGHALDDEENFMNYRRASVTGYSRDTDGIVYYEVIIRSIVHGPLSAYKVRRRYSEFRDLHVALSKVMGVSHRKWTSVTAMASLSDESKNNEDENDVVVGGLDGTAPTLPPLPDKGGVWSYLLFDSIPLLERRAKYFHAMLTAAQQHPMARASRLLNDFVGTPPDLVSFHSSVENSYVSLNRFAAPKLSFAIEIQERKEKAKSIRRRRSSLQRQSFTGSLDTTSQ